MTFGERDAVGSDCKATHMRSKFKQFGTNTHLQPADSLVVLGVLVCISFLVELRLVTWLVCFDVVMIDARVLLPWHVLAVELTLHLSLEKPLCNVVQSVPTEFFHFSTVPASVKNKNIEIGEESPESRGLGGSLIDG